MIGRISSLLILVVFSLPAWGQDGPPPSVKVGYAVLQAMAPMTQVAGTVVSRSNARIAAEVPGRLLEVLEVGSGVEKGDVLARIEDTGLRLQRTELQAELKRAQARLRFAEAEEKRLSRLATNNLAAANQLDQTRSDLDVARSELQVNRARLAQVEDQIGKFVMRAPFDGIVVERYREAAELVASGTEVVRLSNPQHLEVIARVPLEYFGFVTVGDDLMLRTGRYSESGTVRQIVAVGDENTHVFELRIDIPGGLFPAGQTVRVAVPTLDEREVLAVPRDALILRSDSIAVFVIDQAGIAQRVDVDTGIGHGEYIEVIGALNSGDRVVVRGAERLQPGQNVQVVEG